MTPMTTDRANGLVVTSLAVSSALVLVKDAKAGSLEPGRMVVGVAVAGVGMAVLAQLAPTLAGGLALLILTTSVLIYGGPAFAALGSATSNSKSP